MITDYSIGSFPLEQGDDLLRACYHLLGLTPSPTLVFWDMPAETREFYMRCGKFVLTGLGDSEVDAHFERESRKCQLTLVAHSKPE